MRRLALFALLLWAFPAAGQDDVGPRQGETLGNYNLFNSWEAGVRLLDGHGNMDKYRSDVNYGNGVRLFSSSLRVISKDGHGRWFDEIVLTTQGLGNDPYESASWHIEKNRLYRYDGLWRENAYYNPGLPISFGQHFEDTRRRLQDHDLVLFPQSSVRFFAGFSRNTQSGPALSTVQLFNDRGDEFPLFENIRRRQNEYRFGNEFRVFGVRVNWMRSWEEYAEDTWDLQTVPQAGNNPSDLTVLNGFTRRHPYQGDTPSWRASLMREQGSMWALNGRFTYSMGRRNFAFDELSAGIDRFGQDHNRQITVAGDADRPVTTANVTISLFPTAGLTLTNHTSFQNTRMEGNAVYAQVDNASLNSSYVSFQYLGIRNLTNASDVTWRLRKWLALHGGYQYANRRIRSIEQVSVGGFVDALTGDQTNRLHAATAGFELRPLQRLLLSLDGELGRNSLPFYPISEKNYHGLRARALYRTRSYTLSALAGSNYNFNSVSLFSHSARQRQYSLDASWTPRAWFAFEGGYAKLHADTLTGLAFFAANELITNQSSYYVSNLHTAHLGLHFIVRGRVDIYTGYLHAQDTGGAPLPGVTLPALRAVESYPMRFLSPVARVSVRITERVRWNAGYQYYGYSEELLPSQNYGAHTLYTSVLWSF